MNVKAWLAGAAVAVTLTITACSGSPGTGAPREDGGEPPAGGGGGSIDCSAIDGEKVAEYGLYVQLLAQLNSPDQLESFTSIGFTPEKFEAALDNLEPVRSLDAGQFGDPGDALDFYRDLNDTVAGLMAQGDAVTQADVDAYAAQAGGVDNVLAKQLAINAPLSDACPDLDA